MQYFGVPIEVKTEWISARARKRQGAIPSYLLCSGRKEHVTPNGYGIFGALVDETSLHRFVMLAHWSVVAYGVSIAGFFALLGVASWSALPLLLSLLLIGAGVGVAALSMRLRVELSGEYLMVRNYRPRRFRVDEIASLYFLEGRSGVRMKGGEKHEILAALVLPWFFPPTKAVREQSLARHKELKDALGKRSDFTGTAYLA